MGTARLDCDAAGLHPGVAALEASGAHRFDPVRFRYIKAMADRSLRADGAVAHLVAEKALAALQEYRSRFCRERTEVATLVEQIAARQPENAQRVHELFAANEFRAIRRMAGRRQRPPAGATLAALVDRLNTLAAPAERDPGAVSLSDLLCNQEEDALKSRLAATAGSAAGYTPANRELRAARFCRDTRQRQHAEKLVARVVMEAPAESGPLNPHKLAVRSLDAMRELSPAYLGRLVSYLDTLFWLEKAGENGRS